MKHRQKTSLGWVLPDIPGKLKRLRQKFKEDLKAERRGRQGSRQVKSCPAKYDVWLVFKELKERAEEGKDHFFTLIRIPRTVVSE